MTYLVRAELRRDVPAAALVPLLAPSGGGPNIGHSVMWSLFADSPDRTRDFLWRQTGPGHYLALSARPPADPHHLFRLECKPFAPALVPGQRLGFSLRANPVSTEPVAGRRGKRRDVVTRAIAALDPEPDADRRRAMRHAAMTGAVTNWLARQGALHGFAPDPAPGIDNEDFPSLPRPRGAVRFLAVTIEGALTVADPELFIARLKHGFGAAKAFGCGLMLIRPAPAAGPDPDD